MTYVVTRHDHTALVWEITGSSNVNISAGSNKTLQPKRHILYDWKPKADISEDIKRSKRDIR